MRRFPTFCIALVAALAGVTSVAGSAEAKTVSGLFADSAVYDGAFAFYTRSDSRFTKTTLLRQALSGGRPKSVAVVRGWSRSVVAIDAAGSRVAIGIQDSSLPRSKTTVMSFAATGGARKVLASGVLDSGRKSPTASGVCGTVASLAGATQDGAVLVRTTNYLPVKRSCRVKTPATSWRYIAVYPDGRKVVVLTSESLAAVPAASGDVATVESSGSYVAFTMKKSLHVFVVNSATGAVTGPLVDSVSLGGMTPTSNRISLGPNGMVALTTNRFRTKPRFDNLTRTDVFTDPAAPSTAARSDVLGGVQFCGARLVELHYDSESGRLQLRELDPGSLAALRTIATAPPFARLATCTADRALLFESGDRGDSFRSVSLTP